MPDDRETFRKQMHDKLHRELDEFFKHALRLGRSKELKLPADLYDPPTLCLSPGGGLSIGQRDCHETFRPMSYLRPVADLHFLR
jgi:hypothetical protein